MSDDKLQQYGVVMSLLQYESSAFWTRAGFFLIAHTALLGFFAQVLDQNASPGSSEHSLRIALYMSVFGVILDGLWLRVLTVGYFWINRWHKILQEQLEPPAMGDVRVIRGIPGAGRGLRLLLWWPGAMAISCLVALLFGIVWLGALVYCVAAA